MRQRILTSRSALKPQRDALENLREQAARWKIGELADQAHKLANYLGDDHDLFVLREKVTTHRKSFTSAAAQGVLLALIGRCRAQLQENAVILGRRLFEEKPAAFEWRFGKYWRAWQKEREMD